MYDTPTSLQDWCVDFICDNITALCDVQTSLAEPASKLVFKDGDVYFHGNISQQILHTLCDKGKLNDETMTLFDPNVMNLRKVSIQDANVTSKGLKNLRPHKLLELEVTGLKSMTVNDLIGCLGEWTLSNLRVLNVSNSTFVNSAKFCVVVSLSKLKNLQSLNVSNTEFNKHGLDIITEDLPNLESLDISLTPINDISALRRCKAKIKYLSMYNIRASHVREVISVLCELVHLRHLDLSDDFAVQPFLSLQPIDFKVDEFLHRASFPNMTYLDLSGKDGLSEPELRGFLDRHTEIGFLGLSLTKACEWPLFRDANSHIIVTGEATLSQIQESLKRYIARSAFVQKSLYHLFNETQTFMNPREDMIRLILAGMKRHPKQLGVQMAGTACLYNLSKGDFGLKIHPTCLQKAVELTLLAMENFPNHQQLQKNALLTMCSDRILQEVSFDRFHCAKLVMECLCSFDEHSMNRMSVAICSILAAKIPTEQTSILGAKFRYMKKMLGIIKEKIISNVNVDMTLKFTLSALWNLTDESPPTCHVFLNEGGLELFMNVLQNVQDLEDDLHVHVETKVLGLLNNLAEVGTLRHALMREDFIMVVTRLLRSEHIDVSYFAAGIVAHLASDGDKSWLVPATPRNTLLEELHQKVLSWEQPRGEMVAYRSFTPFFPLLTCHETPSVQLWAVWAIQHVCTKNDKRYCPLLVEEKGADILKELICLDRTNDSVREICRKIITLLREKVRGFD